MARDRIYKGFWLYPDDNEDVLILDWLAQQRNQSQAIRQAVADAVRGGAERDRLAAAVERLVEIAEQGGIPRAEAVQAVEDAGLKPDFIKHMRDLAQPSKRLEDSNE